MALRRFAGCGLLLACLLMVQPTAWADDLQVIDTGPMANGVEKGRSDDFYVRFNQPVDHMRSDLVIKRGAAVVEVLQPRFETQPNVLFARRSPLPPGDYTLAWAVKTLAGKVIAVGEIPFRSDGR
jgi:methionine-rich copper-binding protein CopC